MSAGGVQAISSLLGQLLWGLSVPIFFIRALAFVAPLGLGPLYFSCEWSFIPWSPRRTGLRWLPIPYLLFVSTIYPCHSNHSNLLAPTYCASLKPSTPSSEISVSSVRFAGGATRRISATGTLYVCPIPVHHTFRLTSIAVVLPREDCIDIVLVATCGAGHLFRTATDVALFLQKTGYESPVRSCADGVHIEHRLSKMCLKYALMFFTASGMHHV